MSIRLLRAEEKMISIWHKKGKDRRYEGIEEVMGDTHHASNAPHPISCAAVRPCGGARVEDVGDGLDGSLGANDECECNGRMSAQWLHSGSVSVEDGALRAFVLDVQVVVSRPRVADADLFDAHLGLATLDATVVPKATSSIPNLREQEDDQYLKGEKKDRTERGGDEGMGGGDRQFKKRNAPCTFLRLREEAGATADHEDAKFEAQFEVAALDARRRAATCPEMVSASEPNSGLLFGFITGFSGLRRRAQREKYEATINAQVDELNMIQQVLYDLEQKHGKDYDEVRTLRAELFVTPQASRLQPQPQPSLFTAPAESYRDREEQEREARERGLDREGFNEVQRDAKRDSGGLRLDPRPAKLAFAGRVALLTSVLTHTPPSSPGHAPSLLHIGRSHSTAPAQSHSPFVKFSPPLRPRGPDKLESQFTNGNASYRTSLHHHGQQQQQYQRQHFPSHLQLHALPFDPTLACVDVVGGSVARGVRREPPLVDALHVFAVRPRLGQQFPLANIWRLDGGESKSLSAFPLPTRQELMGSVTSNRNSSLERLRLHVSSSQLGTVRMVGDGAVRWSMTSSEPAGADPEWVTESVQGESGDEEEGNDAQDAAKIGKLGKYNVDIRVTRRDKDQLCKATRVRGEGGGGTARRCRL
ncbi:hypothetical protein B0H11DRAFT_1916326 [Mycena galericulata]|nr:hypothetical protein B0H11DRAFT_1916326 [Mycena galericulata]